MEFDGRLPREGINTSPEHPLREFALLVAGLLGAVAACIAIAALAIDRLVPLVPPALEARWFGGWLAPGKSSDPRAAQVQALLDRIASHWDDRPYPFRADVLDEPDPNALALPGGTILVTSGLLAQVASENELALVLGHELGHYRARDQAILRCKEEAHARGYQAVVNLRLETTRVTRASKNNRATAGVEVLAFGTGLELRRDPR
ncbi:MAG: heavy metal-binding domain-containing protein [Deltaproteobacteria bacterium]|nr:MAG: heavy metal-binding domain-containing protein [Deltaproteobacteria bacterium]